MWCILVTLLILTENIQCQIGFIAIFLISANNFWILVPRVFEKTCKKQDGHHIKYVSKVKEIL